jgi:hypothetical protein
VRYGLLLLLLLLMGRLLFVLHATWIGLSQLGGYLQWLAERSRVSHVNLTRNRRSLHILHWRNWTLEGVAVHRHLVDQRESETHG